MMMSGINSKNIFLLKNALILNTRGRDPQKYDGRNAARKWIRQVLQHRRS